jgi:pilus assembly protein Flp/PilA
MINMLRTYLRAIVKSEKGATAVEYGIMVAAIAAVIIAIVVVLGGQVQGAFQTVSDEMP